MWIRLMRDTKESRWDRDKEMSKVYELYGGTVCQCQYDGMPAFDLYKPLKDIFSLTKVTPQVMTDVAVETDSDLMILNFDMREDLKKTMCSDAPFSAKLIYYLLVRMFPNCHVLMDDSQQPKLLVDIIPVSDSIPITLAASNETDYILNHIKQPIFSDILNTLKWRYDCPMKLHVKLPDDKRNDLGFIREKIGEYYKIL